MRNPRVLLLLLVLTFVTVAQAEADGIDFKTQSLGPAATGVLQIDHRCVEQFSADESTCGGGS